MAPQEMVIRFMFPSLPADTSSQSLSIIWTGFRSISVGAISCQGFSWTFSADWGVFPQLMAIMAISKRVNAFFMALFYWSPSTQALMSALEAPFRVLPAFQLIPG